MANAPAIVLFCSKPGMAIIRALGVMGVPVIGLCYGRTQFGRSSRFLRHWSWCPDPNEDETAFLVFLISLADQWPGSVVFPADDASLIALSRHREQLSPHFRLVAGDWQLVRQLVEKRLTYDIAERHGIPCPRLLVTRDVDEAVAFAREIGFPCLLKPSLGHAFFNRFRVKMLTIRDVGQLRRAMAELTDYREDLMLCEFIPGGDACGANYNSFYAGGRPLREFSAEKVRNKPTLIGFPTVVVSKLIPQVMAAGRKMIAAVGLDGFSCTEFKRDERDGIYKLMEVNARHNLSGMLALRCGINFPYLSYLQALQRPLPEHEAGFAENVYWIDEGRDAKACFAALRRGPRPALEHLRPYFRKHVFASWSLTDPLPAVRHAADLASGLRSPAEGKKISKMSAA